MTESRSVQRRIAAQKGQPAPDFSELYSRKEETPRMKCPLFLLSDLPTTDICIGKDCAWWIDFGNHNGICAIPSIARNLWAANHKEEAKCDRKEKL